MELGMAGEPNEVGLGTMSPLHMTVRGNSQGEFPGSSWGPGRGLGEIALLTLLWGGETQPYGASHRSGCPHVTIVKQFGAGTPQLILARRNNEVLDVLISFINAGGVDHRRAFTVSLTNATVDKLCGFPAPPGLNIHHACEMVTVASQRIRISGTPPRPGRTFFAQAGGHRST
jgi:hypothetical protein